MEAHHLTGAGKPVPVILDTDIGQDIDDTWALAMLLGCPQVDLRLIVTDYNNTPERTRLVAKILDTVGRTDIPIATGVQTGNDPIMQAGWVGDYDLARYPGVIHEDGIAALIEAIEAAPVPPVLVTIGPVTNIRAMLDINPGVAEKTRVIAMAGNLYLHSDETTRPFPEYNVACDPASFQALVNAPWPITLSPLDGCGDLTLTGERYARVRASQHPLAKVVIANYEAWASESHRPQESSSILYDTVAAYLSFAESFCAMETVTLRVEADGVTQPVPDGRSVRCQLGWRDREGFEELLVAALTGEERGPR